MDYCSSPKLNPENNLNAFAKSCIKPRNFLIFSTESLQSCWGQRGQVVAHRWCLWSCVVVGTQLNISGEDANLHVSDEHIPGTLRNVPSSPPPASKNEQEMMQREAFSVCGVDHVGLSHMISSACGRAAPGSPGAKRCPQALHNAACHCCSHCLDSLTTVWCSEEHAAKHNSRWEGKTHAVRILKVWLMKYSSQHLSGCWQLLHYECCHSCKKSTALYKGLIFSSSLKPLA